MLEFVMDFCDVVFPLNIAPLTYAIPDKFMGFVTPGAAVKAEVKRSARWGIVLKRTPRPPQHPVKEIMEVASYRPVFSNPLLKLIIWMSEYYFTNEGTVLKSVLPDAVFDAPEVRKRPKPLLGKVAFRVGMPDTSPSRIILDALAQTGYKTHLFPVPTKMHEVSLLISLLPYMRNSILLVPEISDIDMILSFIPEAFNDRIAILHGRLSKTSRIDAFRRIQAGASDIVIGTRIGVFAPLSSVSFIMVLQEQNRSYKNLEGLRYQARDIAVKRGSLENAPVLLSSHCPSVESFHNASRNKYALIPAETPSNKPKVEIINMNTSEKVTAYLSTKTVAAARTVIKDNGMILFLMNRKGFSILQCTECGYAAFCPDCNIPYVYHKTENILKCHYCGTRAAVPVFCSKCRGTSLDLIGAGTQRIASDIERHFRITPTRMDRDMMGKTTTRKTSSLPAGSTITVGTNIVLARLPEESFELCVSLNPDATLRLPDFRSAEHLFQELLTTSGLVKQEGKFIIQTRMPHHYVYRAAKRGDFSSFYSEELLMRHSLSYPPFARMAVITVTSSRRSAPFPESVMKHSGEDRECIGPLKSLKRGAVIVQYLIKTPSSERFKFLINDITATYGKKKGIKVVVDVDPI